MRQLIKAARRSSAFHAQREISQRAAGDAAAHSHHAANSAGAQCVALPHAAGGKSDRQRKCALA